MSLNYTTYVNQLSNLMVIPSTDSNFTTFLPGCIDYAEQRIYRELDMIIARTIDVSVTISSGNQAFLVPSTFIVVESINALSPINARTPMVPVTKEFINAVYPNTVPNTLLGVPQYFAPRSNGFYLVGPATDATYTMEIVGTSRPTALSSSNASTSLCTYCPDLFMAASMVFATGYQRDFGSESDDPKSANSWEQQYQNLLASAVQEQQRAKFEGSAWTPMIPVQGPPPRV